MQLPGALCCLSPQKFSLKTCFEKVSYIFLKKAFSIFQEMELFIFSLKTFLLNLGKGIFRTLACLKLEAYSEPKEYSENTVKNL